MVLRGYILTILLLLTAAATVRSEDEPNAAGLELFEKKIRPVLVANCYECHSAEAAKAGKLKGGLQLDTRASIRAGGESGPAVVPGNVKASHLLSAIRHESFEMPPKGKLSDEVIRDFQKWIDAGAPDPRDGPPAVAQQKTIDFAAAREHWAYRPVNAAPLPKVKDIAWPRRDLDRFVLARIEAAGFSPAADAQPHALLRRLSFDLAGLPLNWEDADENFEALVEQLLSSPRFGEHWARHWLDGVRFNVQLATADRYRDWVVRAINADMPYDQFLMRQLAGDLLTADSDEERDDNSIATQLLCLNVREMDRVEGMIEVVGQQLLGVSLNCAKCHDHRFDAYSQQDYYALAGIFTSTKVKGDKNPQSDGLPIKSYGELKIMGLVEDKVGDTNLLIRGERDQRGPLVPRRFPQVLAGDTQTPLGQMTKESGRLQLAQWIASPRNPLTARVMVNRVWQRLFGRGLVASPNDFGAHGERPANPELLDHLAERFVKSGWSLKALVREIVLSHTYRQSSLAGRSVREQDPDNLLVARMNLRRLQYEQIIDSLLSISGGLQDGPPPIGKKNKPGSQRFDSKEPTGYRALYHEDPINRGLFDGADPELLNDHREASVTAPQLLFFMNNFGVQKVAASVARRAEQLAASADHRDQIVVVYRLLFARRPTSLEIADAVTLLEKHPLERFCHVLLATSEFIYLE